MPQIDLRRNTDNGTIYSHVRKRWLVETPEELVRQRYLLTLTNDYGFALDQIGEEFSVTGRGSGNARADFLIWKSAADKREENTPFIVVECKSDNVTISPADYSQGENYARITNSPFFVTHNSRETKYWRVRKDKVPGYVEEIENIPHAESSEAEVKELLSKLRIFKEKEFADLLHQCHNIIRNLEHKDPAAAFDEIAKVLFTKVYVEREMLTRRNKTNLFTVDVLNQQIADDPLNALFTQTKMHYAADKIFSDDDRINLRPTTGSAIVKKLERYNLSDTSEDVKGVAFEKFLGKTFRGEIGQFFTPRTIVEFMVHMIDPKENELVCDPASGSGGFLIRVFEIVREAILEDIDRQYDDFRKELEATESSEEKRAKQLVEKYAELQAELDQSKINSKLWTLANRCIFGTDANDRMARTSKMNMIMHGDGHGGVHHHDGFLDVNGIFDGRFDIILTNPPFGSNVEPTHKVSEGDIYVPPAVEEEYTVRYGEGYTQARDRLKAALHQPVTSLFSLPSGPKAKIKTEILFLERCLNLLKPGGRLGIVLPEGIFNNPSLSAVREFVEDKAYIDAVVSLPQETFMSSGASVKCSLLFLTKFSDEEARRYSEVSLTARKSVSEKYKTEIENGRKDFLQRIAEAAVRKDSTERTSLRAELTKYEKSMALKVSGEARDQARKAFDYQIFMYEARNVGITATGDEDANELYPNPNQQVTKTCLEWYREFRTNRNREGISA